MAFIVFLLDLIASMYSSISQDTAVPSSIAICLIVLISFGSNDSVSLDLLMHSHLLICDYMHMFLCEHVNILLIHEDPPGAILKGVS